MNQHEKAVFDRIRNDVINCLRTEYRKEAGGLHGFVDLLSGDVNWPKVMEQFKNLTERYCPKLGGNVPLENMYDDEGNVYMRCLFSYKCTWYECEKHMPAFPNR